MWGADLFRRLNPFRGKAVPAKRQPFEGAAINRLMQDWLAASLSADQEVRWSNRVLRARGRDLIRNNPFARNFIGLCAANIVGPSGFKLRATVRTNADKLDVMTNEKIEDAWEDWVSAENCTVDGKMGLTRLCQHIIEAWCTDGEQFVRIVRGYDNRHGFALQVLDSDQIDENYNAAPIESRNEIRMGVEIDSWGKPIAYHVLTRHPSDTGAPLNRIRVPAEDMIHIFRPQRVNQTRGVTPFAPVMTVLRHLDKYIESEVVAARVGAAKMAFFKPDPAIYGAPEQTKPAGLKMSVEPGNFEEIPVGYDLVQWNPDHPSANFPNFVKAMLRSIASGLGVPYVTLANDLEGVNYSSIRQGELNGRDQWKLMQGWFAEVFLERVYREWLKMARLTGAVVLDARDPRRFLDVEFQGRGWSWVDPLKDVQASILAIENQLSTRSETVGEEGNDFEDILETIGEEEDLAKFYGVSLAKGVTAKPTGKQPADGGENSVIIDPAAQDVTQQIAADKSAAVQDTALNGAQVTALLQIIADAAAKGIPVDAVEPIIYAAFPLIEPDLVKQIVDSLKNFKPENQQPAAPPPADGAGNGAGVEPPAAEGAAP